MLRKMIVVFCILFFPVTVVFAAHPLSTDDTGIVGVGKYELEIGYENANADDERNHSSEISFKQGITEKMDIGIGIPMQLKPKTAEPFGDMSLCLKYLLIKDLLAFSASNDLGSNQYALNGILTKEISGIALHANLGYETSGNSDIEGVIGYSGAVEYPISEFDLVGELLGEKTGLQDWLIGLRYKIGEVTAVNCGYGNGFRNTDEKIAFGFHTEF